MPRAFKPELDTGDILSLYRIRYNDGQEGRIRWISSEMRELCALRREPKIPKQYEAITKTVKTPFIRDAAQRITSSLLAKQPIVHVIPKNTERAEYRAAASTCERADMAMKEYLNKERGQDIDYNLAYQLVRDGGSVLKVIHRPDAWANFPMRISDEGADELYQKQEDFKRGASLPFLWKDIDRQSMVFEGGEYGDEWVIEYAEYAKPFLKQRYGMVEDSKGKLIDPKKPLEGKPMPEGLKTSATGITTKIEFFNAKEWHVIIDGTEAPGFPKPSPYAPYLPYFRASAYDEESLLYSMLFLVPRLDELLTMQLNWAYLGAYPIPVLGWTNTMQTMDNYATPAGNAGDIVSAPPSSSRRINFEPGKFFDTPWGRELKFLDIPPVGQDIDKLVSIFKSLIDTAGVPSIMRGVAASGDSGYLANQLRAAAQMAFRLAATALQRQQEKAFEFTHWMISHIVRQTVYVLGWESINPKTGLPLTKAERTWIGLAPETDGNIKHIADLSKIATVDIQYRAQLPTDEQAMSMIALQLTNAKNQLMDKRTALEKYIGEEDPDQVLNRIWVEQAESSGPLQQLVIENALREAGMLPAQQPQPVPQGIQQPDAVLAEDVTGAEPGGPTLPPSAANVPGINVPILPEPPKRSKGVPGNPGGRKPGMFPGRPGGPNMKARGG